MEIMLTMALLWTTMLGFLLLLLLAGLLFSRAAQFRRLPPGPRPLPLLGHLHLVGDDPFRSFTTLAQKYGPIMYLRLGSCPTLVVSSASIAKEILKLNDLVFASRPRNQACKLMFYDHMNVAFMPYGTRWRQMRMLYATEFLSPRKLESKVDVREDEMMLLLRSVWDASRRQEKVLNLDNLVSLHALNLIMRVIISRRLSSGPTMISEDKELRDLLEEMFRLSRVPFLGDFLPWLRWFDIQGYLTRMKKVQRMTDAFATQVVDERRKERAANPSASSSRDFLDVLLSATDDEKGLEHLSDDAIKGSILELFGAGSGSSAANTMWALAEVLRRPEVMKKAQDELDAVVGMSRHPKIADLPHLKYLQAIVKESFRLHPGPILPRLSTETCNLAGYTIPKGTTVLVNGWAIGRDESTWESPLNFRPERFLQGSSASKVDVLGRDFELIPFGAGRRICPGLRMGVSTVELTLGALLHAFHWQLPNEGLTDTKEGAGPLYPSMLIATPRLADNVYSLSVLGDAK